MNRSSTIFGLFEANEVWYHGRRSHNTEFDLKYTGKGTDQEGPGFYFTTNYNDAAGYANPDGIIMTCKLTTRKMVSPKRAPLENAVRRLIKKAPDIDMSLTNWDEDPDKALDSAVRSMMAFGNAKEVYEAVWADFYMDYPKEYLEGMIKYGFDGVYTTSNKDTDIKHVIMFNPKKIKILKVDKYADTNGVK